MHRRPPQGLGRRSTGPIAKLSIAKLSIAGALLAAIPLASLLTGAPAHAASYRYWSYWWVDQGTWVFATAGPASSMPADGTVEGWRFGITGLAGSSADAPSLDPGAAFDQACAGTPQLQGRKRVAVIIDPGPRSAAPPGELPGAPVLGCASVDVEANGYQVLRSLGQVRTEDGLVCAIGGYPASGCAQIVPDALAPSASSASTASSTGSTSSTGREAAVPTVAPQPATSPGPGPVPLVIGGLAIGAMLGFIWRRRRAA